MGSSVPEEEIVPRGREIYETSVRPHLGPEHEGAFAVVDIESGHYEISNDEEEAFVRAEGKHRDALFFFTRVGPGGAPVPAHRIGSASP